ncbi:MAG: hypothetical protein CM15mV25_1160 [uncultured marine virus]|nr:MAG: hypothetical protein CM15mV25_1160 [uncultured marine virus]
MMDPEKYFTKEVLKQIDEYANKNSDTDQTKNKKFVYAQKTGADYTA